LTCDADSRSRDHPKHHRRLNHTQVVTTIDRTLPADMPIAALGRSHARSDDQMVMGMAAPRPWL
jgi:hypothetical protein